MAVSRDAVLAALEHVIDPELGRPVTDLDMVRDVEIDGGAVSVTIALTVAGCPLRSSFSDQVSEHVGAVSGVEATRVGFDVMTPDERAALTTKLRGGVAGRTKGIAVDRSTRVLAVASGKGGVGKSTLTTNLAAAFASLDYRTGVLDADIYGYSIPHLLGLTQRPVAVDEMIVPPVRNGLKLMSIGFFLDDNAPVMWRGPMLHRALEQFLSDVHWGELDVLLVDMPPGTGDVAISLGQLLPRAEAIVVTTPQPLAQDVAARAALMAQKTNMRLLGVIENMTSEVFGSGGGAQLAESLGTALLGAVPLDAALREAADAGEPLVWADPEPRDLRDRRGRPRNSARGRRRHREVSAARRLGVRSPGSSGGSCRRRRLAPSRHEHCRPAAVGLADLQAGELSTRRVEIGRHVRREAVERLKVARPT
jgi:ATP-binding protein involved in chromosome partitioning